MRSWAVGVFALVVCAGLFWSTMYQGPEASDVQASSYEAETVLRIGFLQKVDSLSPLWGMTDSSMFFCSVVYDSMFSFGDDLGSVGNLVTDYRVVPSTDPELMSSGEPEGSVWEFDLTTNAYWHDGEPLTAFDVAWNINLSSEHYDIMWPYQLYSHFMDYAEVIDENTVRIHFYNRSTEEPMPVSYGDSFCMSVLPRHLLDDRYSPMDLVFTWNGLFTGYTPPVVGTGPFMVGPDIANEYFAGDMITLYKNPSYHWGPDKGQYIGFDRLEMHIYDDETDMRLALQRGYLDVAQFPPDEYHAIKQGVEAGTISNIEVFDGLKCTQYWTEVGINMNEAGPNLIRLDPAVRQAMAMATDKQYIVDNFYYGLGEVGSTLISPVNEAWHYAPSDDELYHFDLVAAEALLEAEGYRYPSPSSTVRVATADSLAFQEGWVLEGKSLVFNMLTRIECPEESQIAAYLKDVWAEIGIQLDYMVMTEAQMSTIVYSYTYDTMIWYRSADIDPNYMLFCQSKMAWGSWSDNRYYNESYEASYWASVSEMDYTKRKEHVDNCQRIHYRDAAYIILAYPYQTYAWRTDTFTGWGDWAADPGRSLDARWGASPLLFDLNPISYTSLVPYEREGRFRVLVPEGWDVQEDALVGDTEFDLYIVGPVHGAIQTNIAIDSERVRGVKETTGWLQEQMDDLIEDLAEMDIVTTVVRQPIYWQGGNYSALRFAIEWPAYALTQDVTLYADRESSEVWMLVCTVCSDTYSPYRAMFGGIAASLDVVENHLTSMVAYVAIGTAAAVAVALAVVAVFVLRKRRPPVSVTQPAMQASAPPGICPGCGNALPPGAAFCPACGGRLTPPR